MQGDPRQRPITLRTLRHMVEAKQKISALTCYDATTAKWLAAAGVHVLLVGDSAGQVILGHDTSMHAQLEFMLLLTGAVKRGAPNSFVMGDMPFMSYQADDAEAVHNAGRFLVEGNADAVKLEVDGRYGDLVAKMSRAGVPVVAHIGWKPQTVRYAGIRTAKIAGRTAAEARDLVEQAQLMEARGAVMLLVEQTPAEVAEQVVRSVRIPVMGCGAGPACHGHVVVLQDLLGMNERHPSFVPVLGEVGAAIRDSAKQWIDLLNSGRYLADHPYGMNEGEADKLR